MLTQAHEIERIDAHLHAGALAALRPACARPAPDATTQPQKQTITPPTLWVNSTSPADWEQVARLAQSHPQVVPFFGLHPWHTATQTDASRPRTGDWLVQLEQLLQTFRAGVGEIGLDRRRAGLDDTLQEEALRAQLMLARRYHRPVTLHAVAAGDWLAHILKQEGSAEYGLLLHDFGGSVQEARQFVRADAYLSLSPRLLRWPHTKQRQRLTAIPPERLLLESDAEHDAAQEAAQDNGLGPRPQPQTRTETLRILYQTTARVLGLSELTLRGQIAANALRFLQPLHHP